jgi:hypothetical protein
MPLLLTVFVVEIDCLSRLAAQQAYVVVRYSSTNDADLLTETPRPCTFFYLSLCKQGDKCTYGHDYFLTAENYAELRANAKKSPCPSINKSTLQCDGLLFVDLNSLHLDQICSAGDSCPSGHYCPRGSKCTYRKQGKCKFIGSEFFVSFVN